MVLAVKQFDKNGWCSQEVISFQRVINTSVPADVFARFKVKYDTSDIILEVYKDYWNRAGEGLICRMRAPYCMTDFFYYYKKKPYIYLLVSFVRERLIFDFLRGNQPQLLRESKEKVIKGDSKECQTFYREDIPECARDLCNYAPLDTIDIW